ncbi:hypothetical protein [Pseudaestuariivita atlantica]|uniref:Sulfotransferase domain-containing protein n=1 Tax=Pseudaestuariivita atlantica TaxID=1317121 RepID=A0A0L1JKF3_9RHOB|nr:hypothetical protein [Pseudaestuariivita atlantica]KNG92239.1 hypothetical protein ATO11_18455 [Pseudaestuariivita atlantica]
MRIAYLHIGMSKAGSTTLQSALDAADLPDHTWPIPKPLRHAPLVHLGLRASAPRENLRWMRIAPEDVPALRKTYRDLMHETLANRDKRHVVFSSEVMVSWTFRKEDVESVRDRLAPYVDGFRIIAYVRDPIGWSQSAAGQNIKLGLFDTINQHLFAYKQRLKMFDDVFGAENVTLVPFDRAQMHGGDIVADFFHRIGAGIAPPDVPAANPAHNREELALMMVRNRQALDFRELGKSITATHMAVSNALRDFGSTPFRYGPAMRRRILDETAEDIAWVEERMGYSFPAREDEDGVDSDEELIEEAAALEAKFRGLLLDMLDTEQDPLTRVAETADLIRMLQMTRDPITQKRMKVKTDAPRRPRGYKEGWV